MSASIPTLEVTGLCTSFPAPGGRQRVVDEVSFAIAPGETLALVGESGCGKSMTALSLLRLVPRPGRIEAGSVRLDGQEVLALGVHEMRRLRGSAMAMVFQEPMSSLNPVQTAGRQVVEAIQLHHPVSGAEARRRTLELFEQVGIPDPERRFASYPHQLSGGMKQRVMIAMALASRPRLLIADEPTTALDVTIQAQILDLLRGLQRELGMALLLITHDLGTVNEIADRIAVMYGGRIVEQAPRRELLVAARHPYTQGLLRSLPAHALRGTRLPEIPGAVPPPHEWPEGCRFVSRCARALATCRDVFPAAIAAGAMHLVWCHAVAADEAPPGERAAPSKEGGA